jgi:hypothetical protein
MNTTEGVNDQVLDQRQIHGCLSRAVRKDTFLRIPHSLDEGNAALAKKVHRRDSKHPRPDTHILGHAIEHIVGQAHRVAHSLAGGNTPGRDLRDGFKHPFHVGRRAHRLP